MSRPHDFTLQQCPWDLEFCFSEPFLVETSHIFVRLRPIDCGIHSNANFVRRPRHRHPNDIYLHPNGDAPVWILTKGDLNA